MDLWHQRTGMQRGVVAHVNIGYAEERLKLPVGAGPDGSAEYDGGVKLAGAERTAGCYREQADVIQHAEIDNLIAKGHAYV